MSDEAVEIRTGDELPDGCADAIAQLLGERLGLAAPVPVSIRQFPSGHSNLTYLVAQGDREFVLRRPPRGYLNIKSGHDMRREFAILSALDGRFAKAPRPLLFVEEDETPMGCPFYLMERVRGLILRPPLPRGVHLKPELLQTISKTLVETLAELHAIDVKATGLARLGRGEGYLDRQVDGWTERYKLSQTDEIRPMTTLSRWLAKHKPAEGRSTLIHNDFKYDNVVLASDEPVRVLAVLDWEMATVGDPLADLGTTLAYWIEPDDPEPLRKLGFVLTATRGNMTRADVVAAYEKASGTAVNDAVFYYALGLFKVAVIAQQIYARFKAGLTKDERFAEMIHAVRALAEQGKAATHRGSL